MSEMKDYTLDEMISFLTEKLNEHISAMDGPEDILKKAKDYVDFRHEEMNMIEQIRNELYKMKMEK